MSRGQAQTADTALAAQLRLARSGDKAAMRAAGEMLLAAEGLRDEEQAFDWFERAGADYELACCLLWGVGVADDPDRAEALAWSLAPSPERTELLAQVRARRGELAALPPEKRAEEKLRRGLAAMTDEQQYRKAEHYLTQAAGSEAGCAGTALAALGILREKGLGREKDPAEAFRLYTLGAQRGDPLAVRRLMLCYYQGIGTEKDLDRAADCAACLDPETRTKWLAKLRSAKAGGRGRTSADDFALMSDGRGRRGMYQVAATTRFQGQTYAFLVPSEQPGSGQVQVKRVLSEDGGEKQFGPCDPAVAARLLPLFRHMQQG